ncbi:hypothetical protein K439DRAFT_369828 [Ramaria rubella]|nr:hypothetical protein K439DRAFT_369828 [Ramaria rubella]
MDGLALFAKNTFGMTPWISAVNSSSQVPLCRQLQINDISCYPCIILCPSCIPFITVWVPRSRKTYCKQCYSVILLTEMHDKKISSHFACNSWDALGTWSSPWAFPVKPAHLLELSFGIRRTR